MNEDRGDARFDALLRDALARAPVPEPPRDFPRKMASLVTDQPEAAAVEIGFTRALVSVAVLAAGACALLFVDTPRIFNVLDRAPWPLLLTTAVAIGAIKLAEIAHVTRFGWRK
jgi:hypothetical protein